MTDTLWRHEAAHLSTPVWKCFTLAHRWMRTQRMLGLAFVGASVAGAVSATTAAGQTSAPQRERGRLLIRPHEVKIAKRTDAVGLQYIDSLAPNDTLLTEAVGYVPKTCGGTKRCPLIVFMHGGSRTGLMDITGYESYAEKYKIIFVAPTSHSDDRGWGDTRSAENVDLPRVDALIRYALEHYAIDPNHIALVGGSAGSGASLDWGYVNGDIFSHVIAWAGFEPFNQEHELEPLTPHGKPPFLIGLSRKEADYLQMPKLVDWMRQKGYSVKYDDSFPGHGAPPPKIDEALAWLVDGWNKK